MNLKDAVAVVTGGARRLGRAIALALSQAGCHVAISYHRPGSDVADTITALRAEGVRAEALAADLTHAAEAHALIDRVVARFGQLDLLVANAGVFERTPLATATQADWDAMFRGNLDTFFFTAQRAGAVMRDRGGAIIALADVAAVRPWVDYAPYSASKAAVVEVVRALAVELAPTVRVNAIAPGPVLFPDGFDPELRRREVDRTLLRRQGSPADIAEAVLFLARADYVTGVLLPVDGGRLLYQRGR
jgi:NAD(P)-dependent dehydrogenase (short-subunit alcohol dehydrogenase family)